MARRSVLFAVERRGERAVRHQRDAVVGLTSVEPCPHRLGHIDQDVLIFIRSRDRNCRCDGRPERGCVAGINGALRPRAVDVVHVEAAGSSHGIDIEFESGLADAGAGGNRRQIELDVADLRGAIDIEQGLGAVVDSGIGGVGVGVA